MRNAFIDELILQARLDPSIFLLVGDLGYGVVEPFAREFPNRFLNAGVAEQNMMGMAAGLSSSGYKVFVYSIGNFPTLRCLEQIRNDVCYHNLNVSIVSIGAGLSYGNLGYSHHAIEDIGILRCLPGIKIYSPADPLETRMSLRHSISTSGPSYFRLGKSGEKEIFTEVTSKFPKSTFFGENSDTIVITTGSILSEVLLARELLSKIGVGVKVMSVPILKPIEISIEDLGNAKHIVVVEEHSLAGGLSSLVCEEIVTLGISCKVMKLALPDSIQHNIGSQKYLRSQYGIDSESIFRVIQAIQN